MYKVRSMNKLNIADVNSIVKVNLEEKKAILEMLGYDIDNGKLIINETQKIHKCPINKRPVTLEEASIVPGSTLVIKSDAISFAEYFAQYFKIC